VVTHYLRWFHNRSTMTLVPSASQRLELERRHFERLGMLSRGVDSQLFHPAKRDNALRERWGLGNDDIAVFMSGAWPRRKTWVAQALLRRLAGSYPQRA
jgi:hypothetical protein